MEQSLTGIVYLKQIWVYNNRYSNYLSEVRLKHKFIGLVGLVEKRLRKTRGNFDIVIILDRPILILYSDLGEAIDLLCNMINDGQKVTNLHIGKWQGQETHEEQT